MTALEPGDRVLVTRLDYLGDVIMSLALVDGLRAAHPGIEIDYLTRRPASDLLSGDARFRRVLTQGAGPFASLVTDLRKGRYTSVIDLYSNPRSALLSWVTGAGVRVGGDRRTRRRFYTHPVTVEPSVRSALAHHARYGALLGVDPAPRKPTFEVTAAERAAGADRLASTGVGGGRRTIGVHPGGKWDVKRWPAELWAGFIASLTTRSDVDVVLLTGPDEASHTDALRERVGDSVRVMPPLPIRELAAVVASLDAVALSDGGVMHLAVALGTPTVAIFGSAEPDIWFPYESMGPYRAAWIDITCRPCHRHICPLGHTNCLNGINPDDVVDMVLDVMNDGGAKEGKGALEQ